MGYREFPAGQGGWRGNFYTAAAPCTVSQTPLGQAAFFSALYTIADHLATHVKDTQRVVTVVREFTGNLPLVHALHALSLRKSLSCECVVMA